MDFEELKKRSGAEGHKRLAKLIRFDIAEKKQTKLNKTLGSRSEITLLTKAVSEKHQRRLFKKFQRRWGKFNRTEEQERLRFWTVLGSLAEVDEREILNHVEILEGQLIQALKAVRGVEVIGVFEIEIVNFKVMKKIADQSDADEARKLLVLSSMLDGSKNTLVDQGKSSDSYALVHFHGIIDFKMNAEFKVDQLRIAAKEIWRGSHRVEMKRLHTTKTTRANLRNLSKYLVKGGNESLIYKIGFGWDSVENMERQMLKQGKEKLGADFQGFYNELSLTVQEVKVLGSGIDNLMGRRGSTMGNGYLFNYGQ